jgi:cell division protease FtsH
VALAGRAAEQIVFGRVTNGASNDLEKVTEIARAMVFEYGMSEARPRDDARRQLRPLGGDEAAARLGAGTPDRPRIRGAQRLLIKHRASLDRLASQLLERETLNREELQELLGDVGPESRSSETIGTVRALPE